MFKPISLVTALVICLAGLLIAGVAFVQPAHAGHTATTTIAARSCQWHLVPSPTPAAGQSLNEFEAVAAVAKNDIWSVGHSTTQGQRMALIAHWDGSAWHVILNPAGTQPADLTALTAISARQVWAVGSISNASLSTSSALIERWHGKSWSTVSSPDTNGVTVTSSHQVWAAGDAYVVGGIRPLIAHWNGHAWDNIQSPSSSLPFEGWYGISSVPGNNQIWTVGYAHKDQYATQGQTLTATSC